MIVNISNVFDAIMSQAVKSGEFSTLFLVVACALLASVVMVLYRKNEALHKENSELLREMLDHSNQYNGEKTRLIEEINKTIAILLATLSQSRSNGNG